MKEILALKELEEMNACSPAVRSFKKVFGEEAELKQIVAKLHESGHRQWEAWLLSQNLELTKALLRNGANIHAWDDWALCLAVWDGHLEIVKCLVENGANIHARNDLALCWAAKRGYFEIVKCLVENGVDVHGGNDFPLRWAASNGHQKVVEFLKQAEKR